MQNHAHAASVDLQHRLEDLSANTAQHADVHMLQSDQHARQSRRALMHSAAGVFCSCLLAVAYEWMHTRQGLTADPGYLVNFIAGMITSALAFERAYHHHPKQALGILGCLLFILCFHTTVVMGLGLRAPIMVLFCVLILGVNFALGRKQGRAMLWTGALLIATLFGLENFQIIPGMSAERHPPPINAFMMLLCLYVCAYVFSSAYQQRSDQALAALEDKNTALEQALADKELALTEKENALAAKLRAQAAKDRFLATMSHEIRTPMAGIRTAIALLQNPRVNDAARTRYLTALDTTTESLLRLLNDLLDTAQLEAGALNVQNRPVNLEALVLDTVALFELSARQKSLQLNHSIRCAPGNQLNGDPARLRQMLSNLLGNAIKFTREGSIHVDVSQADPRNDPDLWVFRITDTGPGISAQDQAKLFKPFSQLDNQSPLDLGGSGLGLSIVRKLAEAMGGQTGVISTTGVGSTFWFSARLANLPAEEPVAANA